MSAALRPSWRCSDSLRQTRKTEGLSRKNHPAKLLNFWATWCQGCKEEIPWFSEFEHKYGAKGLSVVGISLDEDGWKMMKPFIKTTAMPYRIALRIDDTVKQYNIENMLKTFLIDVGLVDKDDVENDIRAPLA